MKILHAEFGRHRYGGVQQVLYLLRGLINRGIENAVICERDSDTHKALKALGLKCFPVRSWGNLDPSLIWRMRSVIDRYQPDVLHLHSRQGADVWGGFAARDGMPVVLSRRIDHRERPRVWVRYKYQYYDRVITISDEIRRVLIDSGVPTHKLRVVRSAVDTDKFVPHGDRAAFHRKFSLPLNRVLLATVAQLIPRKGHGTMLEALSTVRKRFPSVMWVVFGKGPELSRLRYLARKQGLLNHLTFAGYQPDMQRWLPAVDLVIHPAMREGLGVALLEAAACGRPIIASDVGGIPETVRNGETGVLIPPRDSATLAATIIGLLENHERRQQLGASARAYVQKHFSVDAMVESHLAVYKELIARRDELRAQHHQNDKSDATTANVTRQNPPN